MSAVSAPASVRYERHDHVVVLTIDRAGSANALDPETIARLRDGLARAQAEPQARAIVLTGAGDRAFCAGADLKPASGSFEPDHSATTNAYADLLREGLACSLPLVARINGHCLAGGMGLLAVCDLAVAVDRARFGLPEVKVGVFPMQVLAVLRRLVPPRVLAEMCLTGEPLVARVVDKSPTAQRRGKYAMHVAAGMDVAEALAFYEGQIATLALTEDAREGRRAFVERRPPVWTNR